MNNLSTSRTWGAQKQIVFGETLKTLENVAESVVYGNIHYVAVAEPKKPNEPDNKSSMVIGFYTDDTVTVRAYALYKP